MKNFFVFLLAGGFLLSGFFNVLRQIRITGALDEIVRFINLVKTELYYRTAEYEEIFSTGELQNYKYLSFSNGEIFVNAEVDEKINREFNTFIKRIGTTDENGQLSLCDEYKTRFEELLENRKTKEKERFQVNTALSVLGALCVLIFFL